MCCTNQDPKPTLVPHSPRHKEPSPAFLEAADSLITRWLGTRTDTQLSFKHHSEAFWSYFLKRWVGLHPWAERLSPWYLGDSTQQPELGVQATAAPNLWRELARPTATLHASHSSQPPHLSWLNILQGGDMQKEVVFWEGCLCIGDAAVVAWVMRGRY